MNKLLIVISVIIILLGGCKKDKQLPEEQDLIIPETTKVISNEVWNNTVISIDTNNFKFTFDKKPDFSIGDIIVTEADGGYLRKVRSINKNGDNYVVETDFATITEAIENVNSEYESSLVVDEKKLSNAFFAKGVFIDETSLKNSDNNFSTCGTVRYSDA